MVLKNISEVSSNGVLNGVKTEKVRKKGKEWLGRKEGWKLGEREMTDERKGE